MGERDRDLPDAAERRARLATWLLVPSWSALLGILLTWGGRSCPGSSSWRLAYTFRRLRLLTAFLPAPEPRSHMI
jgi:hypothetical protein